MLTIHKVQDQGLNERQGRAQSENSLREDSDHPQEDFYRQKKHLPFSQHPEVLSKTVDHNFILPFSGNNKTIQYICQ